MDLLLSDFSTRPGSDPIFQITEDFDEDEVLAFAERISDGAGGDKLRHLAAAPVGEMRKWIPALLDIELGIADGQPRTTYWIPHPMSPSLRRELPTKENGYRSAWFSAKKHFVRGLNVVPLDLDVGRSGTATTADAMRILVWAWQTGSIPAPSWTVMSGRGAYALWRLRDPDGGIPRNTWENQIRWKQIQKRLFDITEELRLEPDANALNINRWLKSPGTKDVLLVDGKNIKSGLQVVYSPWLQASGKPPVYTFDELEEFLGIERLPEPPVEPSLKEQRAPRSALADGDRNGSHPWRARAKEILDLSNYRRGMREGFRHSTLFFYYGCVRSEFRCLNPGASPREAHEWARDATHRLNGSFMPPLPGAEVDRAIKRNKGGPKTRWKAATLAQRLGVTIREAEELGLYAIAPVEVREKRRQEEQEAKAQAATARKLSAHDTDQALLKNPHLGDLDIARLLGDPSRRVYVYQRRKRLRAAGKLSRGAPTKAKQLELHSAESRTH